MTAQVVLFYNEIQGDDNTWKAQDFILQKSRGQYTSEVMKSHRQTRKLMVLYHLNQ